MKLIVEIEREDDGRWLAEITELPGVMAYGSSQDEARARAQALALRVIATASSTGAGPRHLGEIGPTMLSRIARNTGLKPEDL